MILLFSLFSATTAQAQPAPPPDCPELQDSACTLVESGTCFAVCKPTSSPPFSLLDRGSHQRRLAYNPAEEVTVLLVTGGLLAAPYVRSAADSDFRRTERTAPVGSDPRWTLRQPFDTTDAGLWAGAMAFSAIPFDLKDTRRGTRRGTRYLRQRLVMSQCLGLGQALDPLVRFADRAVSPDGFRQGQRAQDLYTHTGLAAFSSQAGCALTMSALTTEEGWGGRGRYWRYTSLASLLLVSGAAYRCPVVWKEQGCTLSTTEILTKLVGPAVIGAWYPHLRRMFIGHRKAVLGRGQRSRWRERGP